MEHFKIIFICFLILALISIQYTLNKILLEIKKLNLRFEDILRRGGNHEKDQVVKSRSNTRDYQ